MNIFSTLICINVVIFAMVHHASVSLGYVKHTDSGRLGTYKNGQSTFLGTASPQCTVTRRVDSIYIGAVGAAWGDFVTCIL